MKIYIIEWESPTLPAVWDSEYVAGSKEQAIEAFIEDHGVDAHIRDVTETTPPAEKES